MLLRIKSCNISTTTSGEAFYWFLLTDIFKVLMCLDRATSPSDWGLCVSAFMKGGTWRESGTITSNLIALNCKHPIVPAILQKASASPLIRQVRPRGVERFWVRAAELKAQATWGGAWLCGDVCEAAKLMRRESSPHKNSYHCNGAEHRWGITRKKSFKMLSVVKQFVQVENLWCLQVQKADGVITRLLLHAAWCFIHLLM